MGNVTFFSLLLHHSRNSRTKEIPTKLTQHNHKGESDAINKFGHLSTINYNNVNKFLERLKSFTIFFIVFNAEFGNKQAHLLLIHRSARREQDKSARPSTGPGRRRGKESAQRQEQPGRHVLRLTKEEEIGIMIWKEAKGLLFEGKR